MNNFKATMFILVLSFLFLGADTSEDSAAKALKSFEQQLLTFGSTSQEYKKTQFDLLLNAALKLANDQDIKHQNLAPQLPKRQRKKHK